MQAECAKRQNCLKHHATVYHNFLRKKAYSGFFTGNTTAKSPHSGQGKGVFAMKQQANQGASGMLLGMRPGRHWGPWA